MANNTPTRGVDQNSIGLHHQQLLSAEEVAGDGSQWQVQRDDIGLSVYLRLAAPLQWIAAAQCGLWADVDHHDAWWPETLQVLYHPTPTATGTNNANGAGIQTPPKVAIPGSALHLGYSKPIFHDAAQLASQHFPVRSPRAR